MRIKDLAEGNVKRKLLTIYKESTRIVGVSRTSEYWNSRSFSTEKRFMIKVQLKPNYFRRPFVMEIWENDLI